MLKCPYYPKPSTDTMQYLSKFSYCFIEKPEIHTEPKGNLNSQNDLEAEINASCFLVSKYTTKW